MGNDKTVFVRIATGRRNSLIIGDSKLSPAYYREVKDIESLKKRVGKNNLEVWTETVNNETVVHTEPLFHVISIDNGVLESKLKEKNPLVNGYPIKMIEKTAVNPVVITDYDELDINEDAGFKVSEVMAGPAVAADKTNTVKDHGADSVFVSVSENGTGGETVRKRGRRQGS